LILDTLLLFKAALMGVVEGLTEFLPISSTGHLVLVGSLIDFNDERAKVFDIAIQSGAILAVLLVFWQKVWYTLCSLTHLRSSRLFAANVLIAFLPAAFLGVLLSHFIKAHLFNPQAVASTFILGGLVILWVERWGRPLPQDQHPNDNARVLNVESMTPKDALMVGMVQCLALIPGTSRSGATIIGGMLFGLSRKAATEFSFYLAIPTLLGAGVYSLYKERALLSVDDWPLFMVGLVISFVSAWICVKWLLRYISTHSFVPFAYYRIVFGLLIWGTAYFDWVKWSA
jgi:undecaprenyl-diphosphatase